MAAAGYLGRDMKRVWLPIETAPKNKRIMLSTIYGIVIGRWTEKAITRNEDDYHSAWMVFDCEDSFYNSIIEQNEATHWMPLPNPPPD